MLDKVVSSPGDQSISQTRHPFSPVDINQILDQDEHEIALMKNKVIYVDSDGDEVDVEDEEDDQAASPSAESPTPYVIPYVHPLVLLHEKDIDYPEDMSEEEKVNERCHLGKLACVSLSSTATDKEIEWVMQFYYQEGLWARPRLAMPPHIFNIRDFTPPRIVLTLHLVKLGVGAPLHPYFRPISEWFDIAPIQLSPNSFRLAIALYIMYVNKGFPPPSMED